MSSSPIHHLDYPKAPIATPQHQAVVSLLDRGRLGEALPLLAEALAGMGRLTDADTARQLQTHYDLLLQYYAQGAHDATRADQQDSLYAQAYTLADRLLLTADSATALTAACRSLTDTLEALRQTPHDEEAQSDAFRMVVAALDMTRDEQATLGDMLLDDDLPLYVRGMLLGAVTMGLLRHFDAALMENLYLMTLDDQPPVLRMRAWVMMVLTALQWPTRIAHCPRLREQLGLMADTEPDLLGEIQVALLLCSEAGGFEQKMQKMLELEDVEEETIEGEEGQTMRVQRIRIDKEVMMDIIATAVEGSDLSYETFCKMGATQPFFNSPAALHHWLMPFHADHPTVAALLAERPSRRVALQMARRSPISAHSDLYSSFLMLCSLFSERIEALGEQLMKHLTQAQKPQDEDPEDDEDTDLHNDENAGEQDDIHEEQDDIHEEQDGIHEEQDDTHEGQDLADLTEGQDGQAPTATPRPDDDPAKRQMQWYLHDVYRLMTLTDAAQEVRSPFDGDLDMARLPWFRTALATPDMKRKMAELMLRKGRWHEATAAYRVLLQSEVSEDALHKLAYAAEKESPEGSQLAIDTLLRCQQLFGHNRWTVRHLADQQMRLGQLTAAEVTLHDALSSQPDETAYLWRLGRCLCLQDRAEEAQELLFKADVLREGNLRIQREVAQCCFLAQNHSQAERYVRMVLARPEPEPHDWLLGGHIALQGGDIPLALQRYGRIAELHSDTDGGPSDDLLPAYDMDYAQMLRAGIDAADIALMREAIRSVINN